MNIKAKINIWDVEISSQWCSACVDEWREWVHVVCVNQNVEKGAYWRSKQKDDRKQQKLAKGLGRQAFIGACRHRAQ